MPKQPGPGRVPAHDHQWYPIATVAGQDELWACATLWRCIKTATRTKSGLAPKPAVPVPTKGLWSYAK